MTKEIINHYISKKEFNLSEKIGCVGQIQGLPEGFIPTQHVKEFIKITLDIIGKLPESADTVRAFHTIKERAGEELSK